MPRVPLAVLAVSVLVGCSGSDSSSPATPTPPPPPPLVVSMSPASAEVEIGETVVFTDVATMAPDRELGPTRGWRFQEGDAVRLRLFNNPKTVHLMHLHGQRFLVLEQDGLRMDNLVWRDTAVVPVGAVVEVLIEMSNPGVWMLNCQIPEHVGSGMSISFTVQPAA